MIINTVGKRKKAVARATIKEGSGKIRINKIDLSTIQNRYIRIRLEEPLILIKDMLPLDKLDISINIAGGGIWGQADAARTAMGKCLVNWAMKKKKTTGENIKKIFTEYDRTLIVSDARRTEPHKPSRSSAGPRRKKQQSKR